MKYLSALTPGTRSLWENISHSLTAAEALWEVLMHFFFFFPFVQHVLSGL